MFKGTLLAPVKLLRLVLSPPGALPRAGVDTVCGHPCCAKNGCAKGTPSAANACGCCISGTAADSM